MQLDSTTVPSQIDHPSWISLNTVCDQTSGFVSHPGFDAMRTSLLQSADRGLILYEAPVATVAHRLEQGISTTDVINQWRLEAGVLLRFLRQHRRKLVLTERPGGVETLQSLSAFFPNITPAVLDVEVATASPAATQLAALLLTLDRPTFDSWSELQASSTGYLPPDIDPLMSVGNLASEWNTLRESHQELLRDQHEIGPALQKQIQQLEDSLKTTENARNLGAISNETLASRIVELKAQLQRSTVEQMEISKQLRDVQTEKEKAADRLEQLSDELEIETQCALQNEQKLLRSRKSEEILVTQVRELEAGLRAKVEEAARQAQELKDQLDAVHASNSWRITAPIRAVVLWWRG